MTRIVDAEFDPKKPGERVPLAFDFAALTTSPSNPVVVVTRHAGEADASPSTIKSGTATINGSKAVQFVDGGVDGTRYLVTCTVDAPDGSRWILSGVLPVEN